MQTRVVDNEVRYARHPVYGCRADGWVAPAIVVVGSILHAYATLVLTETAILSSLPKAGGSDQVALDAGHARQTAEEIERRAQPEYLDVPVLPHNLVHSPQAQVCLETCRQRRRPNYWPSAELV
jgi:hypothetical protein